MVPCLGRIVEHSDFIGFFGRNSNAYSGRKRPPFRWEKGHYSGVNAASIPVGKRPPFRSNPASVK
jgi:hypothetical protein